MKNRDILHQIEPSSLLDLEPAPPVLICNPVAQAGREWCHRDKASLTHNAAYRYGLEKDAFLLRVGG